MDPVLFMTRLAKSKSTFVTVVGQMKLCADVTITGRGAVIAD